MTILVTGGAGFIGANFVLDWIAGCDEPVVNLDKLTYAGSLETLASLQGNPRHLFVGLSGQACHLDFRFPHVINPPHSTTVGGGGLPW